MPAERRTHKLFLLQGWQQLADLKLTNLLKEIYGLNGVWGGFTNTLSLKKHNAPGKDYQCNPKKEHTRSAITGQ